MTARLPLHELLNIPLENLVVVGDNAISPANSLSSAKQQQLYRRKSVNRSVSERNRWSSSVPQVKTTEDGPRSPVVRVSSFDGPRSLFLTVATAPSLSMPIRRSTPPSSPTKRVRGHGNQGTKNANSPFSPVKSGGSSASFAAPLRLPVRQPSPAAAPRTTVQRAKKNSSTTSELLDAALVEIEELFPREKEQ